MARWKEQKPPRRRTGPPTARHLLAATPGACAVEADDIADMAGAGLVCVVVVDKHAGLSRSEIAAELRSLADVLEASRRPPVGV